MIKRISLYCLVSLYPLFWSPSLRAQTCSCAGAPLLSSQSVATTSKGDLLVGVSGLLFRNNLIPYDRNTGSLYSQMQIRSVSGSQIGTILQQIPLVQTSWKVWKTMYPESEVLTTNTGFNKDYNQYTYGRGYLEGNSDPLFSVKNPDTRLQTKELVHGIIAGEVAEEETNARVYVIDKFGSGVHVIEDRFASEEVIVAGSSDLQFAVSFHRTFDDGTTLQFEAVQDALPIIIKDQEVNSWDIFGYAVEGPRVGTRLSSTNSYTGYWFAWADFFPNLEIHQLN